MLATNYCPSQNNSSRAPVVAGFPALNTNQEPLDIMPAKITSANDPRVKAICGMRFHKLIAVRFLGMRRRKETNQGVQVWEFKCDCGNKHEATIANVKSGSVTSCGCVGKTIRITHGFTRGDRHGIMAKLYGAWSTMIQRCTNPALKCWKNYGGRGITVCNRWRNSFENFFSDMGLRPSGKHTLDRKNNDLGYSPQNCKWATWKEQANNRRERRRT